MLHLLDRLLPNGPVVIGIDDRIERRWGAKITPSHHVCVITRLRLDAALYKPAPRRRKASAVAPG